MTVKPAYSLAAGQSYNIPILATDVNGTVGVGELSGECNVLFTIPGIQANGIDIVIPNVPTYNINVLYNDNLGNEPTTIVAITPPATVPGYNPFFGTFSIASDGLRINYTGGFWPSTSEEYSKEFTYTIEDSTGAQASATVTFALARYLNRVEASVTPGNTVYVQGKFADGTMFAAGQGVPLTSQNNVWYPGGGTAGACVQFGSLQDQTSISWFFDNSIACTGF